MASTSKHDASDAFRNDNSNLGLLSAFSMVIQKRREMLNLSQEELARRAGLNRSYISDIERGARSISLKNLSRLARALELSLSNLIRLAETWSDYEFDTNELILKNMNDGVVFLDLNLRIQFFNDAAQKITTMPIMNVPADRWQDTYPIYLSDTVTEYPFEKRPSVRALRGEVVLDAEVFIRNTAHPNGLWLSVSANPVRNQDREIIGAVVVSREISSRKKSEALRAIEFKSS